jgi:hypothetical protein
MPNGLPIRSLVYKVVLAFLQFFVPHFVRAIKAGKRPEAAISEALAEFLSEVAREIGLNLDETLPTLYMDCMRVYDDEPET